MLNEINVITANLRLQKAREDYNTAKENLKNGFYRAANDRAYFCMHHAANAVCALDDRALWDSCSVLSVFHHYFVGECYIDERFSDMLEAAQKSRFNCTHNDCHIATKAEALRNIKNAELFLCEIESFLTRRVECEYVPRFNPDPDDEDLSFDRYLS